MPRLFKQTSGSLIAVCNNQDQLLQEMLSCADFVEVSEDYLQSDEYKSHIGSLGVQAEISAEEGIRMKRYGLLRSNVDPIAGNALRWAALTAEQQQAWADYRQALLDVPQQAGFPHDVVWPAKPE